MKGQVDRIVLNNIVELNATDEHSDELAEIVQTVRFVEEECQSMRSTITASRATLLDGARLVAVEAAHQESGAAR